MNTNFVSIAVGALLVMALWAPADAQVGNDNPTGPAGMFNGNIESGGNYDPYTGNAVRQVTDIMVYGGVQPLGLVRTANSRDAYTGSGFGYVGSWRHNYSWALFNTSPSTDINFSPSGYDVEFPDGRQQVFAFSASDTYFRAAKGTRERFIPMNASKLCYLVLSDGSKVEFQGTEYSYKGDAPGCHTDPCPQVNWYDYNFLPQAIIDPYGQRTTLTYSNNLLYRVTEPAGRYIQFNWITQWNDVVIGSVTSSDGRSVSYTYNHNTFPPGTVAYTWLKSVSYFGDPNLVAQYTYLAYSGPNIAGTGFPRLNTCVDPMYQGPMWRIAYIYATANNADGTSPVYGQILSENYFDGSTVGAAVSALTVNGSTRTETRGDGETRTFTYGGGSYPAYVLTKATDFNGVAALQGYDLTTNYINSVTDRNNHTTNYTLNPIIGAPTQVQFPATPSNPPIGGTGSTRGAIKYTYGGDAGCSDPNNTDTNNPYYVCTATDEAGNVTRYSRVGGTGINKMRVGRIDYPDGGYETFVYNPSGQVTSHRMTTGGTETFSYDARGMKTSYRDPYHASGNPTAWYLYDTLDRLSDVTDMQGSAAGDPNHTTSYAYNNRGQVTTTTHPTDPIDGTRHTVVNAYNISTGTLTSVTDELSHQTSYTYDDYRRVLSVKDPLNHTTTFSYVIWNTTDSYMRTASTVYHQFLPTGRRTDYNYDENLRKIAFRLGMGTADDDGGTYYAYDNEGNTLVVLDPRGNSTSTSYDERNRPYRITDRAQKVTTLQYDTGGRKASVTRPNGQVVTFDSYDAMNRLLQQTATQSPEPNAITKYTYYQTGLVKTMQDPKLVAVNSADSYRYNYDLMGRKTQLTYPHDSQNVQRTEIWHYNTFNQLDTFTNRDGKVQTMSYDNLYRETGFSWNDTNPQTPGVTFGYDVAGRTITITNVDATITRSYYNNNRLNTETVHYADNIDRTVTYTYDEDGRRASLQYPGSAYTFNYTYTQRGQLDTIVNNANNNIPANYGYDLNGNVSTRTLNNSTSSTYGYDAMDRATSISHALTSGTPATRTLTYDYDSVGNRKWVKRDGGNGDVYGYDLNDQVTATKLDIANPDTTSAGPQTIIYDANGNRTSFAINGGPTDTYTVNQLNQYTNRNTSQAIYDAKGNMTTGLDASVYTYDAQNRLLTAKKGGTTDTFKYDGLNRQISRQVGAAAVVYNVYDGWDLIGEYASGSNTATNAYLYGATGLVKNLQNDKYYYQDASGSTSHLANSSGGILEWYRYGPQGAPFFYDANNNLITATANGVRHLFTGQQWYKEIGLYDLRNRYYSPDIGRFLQADPIGFNGDATNLYRYCGNNPLVLADPLGYSGTLTIVSTYGNASAFSWHGNTGHSYIIYTPDNAGVPTTYATYGNNPNDRGNGLLQDADSPVPAGDAITRTAWLDDNQEAVFYSTNDYYNDLGTSTWNGGWTPWRPCSYYATDAWNAATGEDLSSRNFIGWSTPNALANSIRAANGGQDSGFVAAAGEQWIGGGVAGVDQKTGQLVYNPLGAIPTVENDPAISSGTGGEWTTVNSFPGYSGFAPAGSISAFGNVKWQN